MNSNAKLAIIVISIEKREYLYRYTDKQWFGTSKF